MRSRLSAACLAVALGIGLGGCNDFLTGEGVTDNPNNPTRATNASLIVGAQSNLAVQTEGHLGRTICMWVQQCAGIGQQYLSVGTYSTGEDEFYFEWRALYGQGGLLDLRRVQASARQSGDSTFAGVAMVLEAFMIGIATDAWGDVPYSQAASDSVAVPALDAQEDVYAALQARLDTAILFLGATGTTNLGPGASDLVYGGDRAKWTALAHTLKARFHLHTAEQLGAPAYVAALAEAERGIASPDDDYRNYHGGSLTERNVWRQFTDVWGNYIASGAFLVNLLQSRNDPRLAEYFSENGDGEFVGADPGQAATTETVSNFSGARLASDFRQPLVTWAENRLIIAEAAFRGGDEGRARTELNAVLDDAGVPTVGAGVTGTALLEAILTEKYIRLFQNFEAWNDYRRTCFPRLDPVPGAADLPARLTYPATEAAANPNIPAPEAQPLFNWNDPNRCT
jgi:hypothetical protein